jgi:hypothetical protein
MFGFTENAYNPPCGIFSIGGHFVPGFMFMQDWRKDDWRVPRFYQIGARSARMQPLIPVVKLSGV